MMDWEHGTPIMLGPWELGLGEPSPETLGYWEGVEKDALRIKQCRACGTYLHPRRIFCTCLSDDLAWVQVAGTGTVYTFSTIYRAPDPKFAPDVPYSVGIVELTEGVFLFSRISSGADQEVRIGMPVTVGFATIGGGEKLPVFQAT